MQIIDNNNYMIMERNGIEYLFSYRTLVGFYSRENECINITSKKWSNTTSRHIRKWLDSNKRTGIIINKIDQQDLETLANTL